MGNLVKRPQGRIQNRGIRNPNDIRNQQIAGQFAGAIKKQY